MINTDYQSDKSSSDINQKSIDQEFKTYFDKKTLKIAVKFWITDFYSCEEIKSSKFARKKLIDIFVNQDKYIRKDFIYREENPSLFSNKITLILQ